MVPALIVCAFALATRFDADGVPLPAEAVARVGSALWRHHGAMSSPVASADGRTLFAAADPNELLAWDADTGRLAHRLTLPRVGTPDEVLRLGGPQLAERLKNYRGEGERRIQLAADGRIQVIDRHWDHGSVRTVDPFTGRVIATASYTIPRLRQAHTTRDGRWLVAHTSDEPANHYYPKTHFLHVHDLVKSAVAYAVPVVGKVHDFAFSPDDKLLAVADEESLRFLDPATGKPVRTVATGYWKRVSHFRFRPDSAAVAVWVRLEAAPVRDRLEVWAVAGDEKVTTAIEFDSQQWRADTFFRPDGGQVAVRTDHRTWRLLDAKTGKDAATVALPATAFGFCAAFAADGRRLFVAGVGYTITNGWGSFHGGFVTPFDLTVAKPVARHEPRPLPHHGTFTAAGEYVAVHQAVLTRWHAGRVTEAALPVAVRDPASVAFAPDGSRLAVGMEQAGTVLGSVEVVDLATLRRTTFDAVPNWNLGFTFTPDGRTLLLRDGTGRDAVTGGKVPALSAGDPSPVIMPALLPGGRWLTTEELLEFTFPKGSRKPTEPIRIYDRENWRGWKAPAWEFFPATLGHVRLITPDGRRALVSFSAGERTNELWEGPAGRRRWASPSAAYPMALSPDGRTVVAVSGRTIELIEMATGGIRHRFAGHRGDISISATGAFSPDGRLLAASSFDAPVYLWDVHGELQKPATPPNPAAAWDDLGSADAAVAFQAIRRLAWLPEKSMPLLKAKLPPVAAPDAEKVGTWIADLDAAAFADRAAATKELKALGDLAVPPLEAALKTTASAEVRERIEALLAAAAARPWDGEAIRVVRAVEAVEWMPTPAAKELLKAWANGAAGARLTREAQASLGRGR